MDIQEGSVGKKHRNAGIAVIVILVVLVICILLLLLLFRKEDEGDDRGFVTRENADDIMEDMSEKVAKGMFECKMTTSWTFEDGGSPSPNAYVANVEDNLYTLYFDVYSQPDNELLYSSPKLPTGDEISNIKLDKELPAGEYDAVVMYTLLDEDDKEVSTVGFNITISVQN